MQKVALWHEGALAAFDTETTGIDVENDRIVSAALVVQTHANAAPRTTSWLVSPGIEVPAAATAIHGLSNLHLQQFGRWPAPVMEEVGRALAAQSAAGVPLVIMNAPFDLTILDRELRRHRASSLNAYLGSAPLCVLDPYVMDKHLDRYRKGRRTLGDLCAHYGVELSEAHEAAADARAALQLVRAIGRQYTERLGEMTAAELHARQAIWHAAQARGLQSWFTRTGSTETCDPAWPLRTGGLADAA
ncbi:3'-5' exonuclease [Streptomyces sp. A7024]|uniref:3'-5' exonuclease n=1 Tax=Streptomyces coryli TaxID=1128680 RepID=A0A6G4U0U8_9ACTN|nr:3'-5' exonuclease [Streptomyces coryli]